MRTFHKLTLIVACALACLGQAPAPASAQVVYSGQSIPTRPTAPANSVGVDNAWYLDLTTGIVFGPKTGGVWPTSGAATLALGDLSNFIGPLAVSKGGTGSTVGDLTHMMITPTGYPDPISLADVAASALNQPSVTGSIVYQHLVCGGFTANTLIDCGQTSFLNYIDLTTAPGINNSKAQGYDYTSIGIVKNTGDVYVLIDPTAGAANWKKIGSNLASPEDITWISLSGSTPPFYSWIGGNGVNQNFSTNWPRNGFFSLLDARVSTTPGATQTYVITLYIGTFGFAVATALTCTIVAGATTCPDHTHSATITAGQTVVIKIEGANSPATPGTSNFSLLFTPQ